MGTGRHNYSMACTVHEKIKVSEMSYTHLRCSRPCIATCFAHSGAVRPPSFTWRVCGFSGSHDLEGAHGPAQVAVSKGELVCWGLGGSCPARGPTPHRAPNRDVNTKLSPVWTDWGGFVLTRVMWKFGRGEPRVAGRRRRCCSCLIRMPQQMFNDMCCGSQAKHN